MLTTKPWTMERALVLLLGCFVCFSLASLLTVLFLHGRDLAKVDQGSLPYLLVSTLSVHGSVLVAIVLAIWGYRLKWRDAFGLAEGDARRVLLLGFGAAVIFLPVAKVLQMASIKALELFPKSVFDQLHLDESQTAVKMLEQTVTFDSRIYFVIFSILIAPVVEELFFRGVLYPVIKQLGYPRIAVWVTCLLFAAIHGSWIILIPLFCLSALFIWLYERTNNILAPIAAHATFNGLNLVFFFIAEQLEKHHPA